MYELLILSRLMYAPEHGYQIAKIANDLIGPWAKISVGSFYPLLSKLEQQGYITVIAEQGMERRGQRPSRTFAITDAGRRRFHQLMLDTALNPGEYQRIFHLKVPNMEFLQPDERLLLVNHYITYCEARVHHIQSELRDLLQIAPTIPTKFTPASLEATVDLMQHEVEQWRGEVSWVYQLRQRLAAQHKVDLPTTAPPLERKQ